MKPTLKELFLALDPQARAIAIVAGIMVVAILVLAVACYRSAAHARDLVLEENKAIKQQRDNYRLTAKKAIETAETAKAALLAKEKQLNEINKTLEAERAKLAGMETELNLLRDDYRGARRLSDDELAKLRAKLK